MPTRMVIDELVHLGLIEAEPLPHLTVEGQDYLQALGDTEVDEPSVIGDTYADLILSTNGLSR